MEFLYLIQEAIPWIAIVLTTFILTYNFKKRGPR